jgi:hypothetical protein
MQLRAAVAQQRLQDFYQHWQYQITPAQKMFWVYAVPGLGAAMRHGDWNSAAAFAFQFTDQEAAYRKHYHQPSPTWTAANNAANAWARAHAAKPARRTKK